MTVYSKGEIRQEFAYLFGVDSDSDSDCINSSSESEVDDRPIIRKSADKTADKTKVVWEHHSATYLDDEEEETEVFADPLRREWVEEPRAKQPRSTMDDGCSLSTPADIDAYYQKKQDFYQTCVQCVGKHKHETRSMREGQKRWETFKKLKSSGATADGVRQGFLAEYPGAASGALNKELNGWIKTAFNQGLESEWEVEKQFECKNSLQERVKRADPEGYKLFSHELDHWLVYGFPEKEVFYEETKSAATKGKERLVQFENAYPVFAKQEKLKRSFTQIVSDSVEQFEQGGVKAANRRKKIEKTLYIALYIAFFVSAVIPIFYPNLWWICFPMVGVSIIIGLPASKIGGKADRMRENYERRVMLKKMLLSWKDRSQYPFSTLAVPICDERLKSDTMGMQKEKYAESRPKSVGRMQQLFDEYEMATGSSKKPSKTAEAKKKKKYENRPELIDRLKRLSDQYDLATGISSNMRSTSVFAEVKAPYSERNSFVAEVYSQLPRGSIKIKESCSDTPSLYIDALRLQLSDVSYMLSKTQRMCENSPCFEEQLEMISANLKEIEEKIEDLDETVETFNTTVVSLRHALFQEQKAIKKVTDKHPATLVKKAQELLDEVKELSYKCDLSAEVLSQARESLQGLVDEFDTLREGAEGEFGNTDDLFLFKKEIAAFRRKLCSLRAELRGEKKAPSKWTIPIDLCRDVVDAVKVIFSKEKKKKSEQPKVLHPTLRSDRIKRIQLDQLLFRADSKLTTAVRIKERHAQLIRIITGLVFLILLCTVGMSNPWIGFGFTMLICLVQVGHTWLNHKIESLEKDKHVRKVQAQLIQTPGIPKNVAGENPDYERLKRLEGTLGLDGVELTAGKLAVKKTIREKKSIFNSLPEIPLFKNNDPIIPAYGASRGNWNLSSSMREKIEEMSHRPSPRGKLLVLKERRAELKRQCQENFKEAVQLGKMVSTNDLKKFNCDTDMEEALQELEGINSEFVNAFKQEPVSCSSYREVRERRTHRLTDLAQWLAQDSKEIHRIKKQEKRCAASAELHELKGYYRQLRKQQKQFKIEAERLDEEINLSDSDQILDQIKKLNSLASQFRLDMGLCQAVLRESRDQGEGTKKEIESVRMKMDELEQDQNSVLQQKQKLYRLYNLILSLHKGDEQTTAIIERAEELKAIFSSEEEGEKEIEEKRGRQ